MRRVNVSSVDLTALLVTLITGLSLAVMFHRYGYDDPYITYRYAANLASGQGFVYNPGEYVLSTTAPLYGLLLALVAWPGIDVPLTANVVGAFSIALGGLALWRIGVAQHQRLAGAASGLIYAGFPLLAATIGSESPLVLALALWGLERWLARSYRFGAVLLALAVLTRADALLAVVVAALWTLGDTLVRVDPSLASGLRRLLQAGYWQRLPWAALAIFLALLLPFLAAAQWYYGAPLPATLEAKQLQSLISSSRTFGEHLPAIIAGYWALPTYRLMLLLALLGVPIAWRSPVWLVPIGWSLLYTLAYGVLHVSTYFWYYAPLVPGLAAAAGVAIAHIARWLEPIRPGLGRATAVGLVLICLAGEVWALPQQAMPDSRLSIYREAGIWLDHETDADASVGTLEVGIVGYYADRPIVDFAGLVQPAVAQAFQPGWSYLDSARWAVARYRPDYLLLQEQGLPLVAVDPSTAAACTLHTDFSDQRYPDRLLLYRCRW
jgi:hypothetical protein